MCFSRRLLQKGNLLLASLILLAGTSAFAQSTFGTFVGTVQDQSGSVVAGAIVTITNLDDNSVRSATTNSAGQYQLLNVPVGPLFDVRLLKAGFATTKVNEVTPRCPPGAARRYEHGIGLGAADRGGECGGCHHQH